MVSGLHFTQVFKTLVLIDYVWSLRFSAVSFCLELKKKLEIFVENYKKNKKHNYYIHTQMIDKIMCSLNKVEQNYKRSGNINIMTT